MNLNLPKSPFIDPFQFVSINLIGPLPVERGSYRHLLTIIDHASRWLQAVPLTNVAADTCANAFISQWIYRYGPPARLHSDRGTQFVSEIFREVKKSHGITKS